MTTLAVTGSRTTAGAEAGRCAQGLWGHTVGADDAQLWRAVTPGLDGPFVKGPI